MAAFGGNPRFRWNTGARPRRGENRRTKHAARNFPGRDRPNNAFFCLLIDRKVCRSTNFADSRVGNRALTAVGRCTARAPTALTGAWIHVVVSLKYFESFFFCIPSDHGLPSRKRLPMPIFPPSALMPPDWDPEVCMAPHKKTKLAYTCSPYR